MTQAGNTNAGAHPQEVVLGRVVVMHGLGLAGVEHRDQRPFTRLSLNTYFERLEEAAESIGADCAVKACCNEVHHLQQLLHAVDRRRHCACAALSSSLASAALDSSFLDSSLSFPAPSLLLLLPLIVLIMKKRERIVPAARASLVSATLDVKSQSTRQRLNQLDGAKAA